MKLQLHRVGLDGKGDVRLTDPAFHHTVGPWGGVSPDSKHFVDVYQTHDTPPARARGRANGKVVAELAKSDLTKFDALGLKKAEMFTYKAADGKTTLHGLIQFPVELRSGEEVSGARARVRRPGVGQQHRARDVRHAERAHRVRLPGGQARLARGAGAWASGRSTRSI